MGFWGDVGDFFKDAGKKLTPGARVGAQVVSVLSPQLGKPVSAGVEFVADKTGANEKRRPVNPGHPPIFNRKHAAASFRILQTVRNQAQAQSTRELVDLQPGLVRAGLTHTPTSDNAGFASAPARRPPMVTPAFQQLAQRDNTGTLVAMGAVALLAVALMMRSR